MERRLTRRALLGAAVATGVGIGLAKPAALNVSRHRFAWPGLSGPLRVAHLTDLHFGWSTPPQMIARAIGAVVEAKPDLVVLSGDYVNHSLDHLSRLTAFVERLPARTLATLGNHDHWSGAREVESALFAGGAEVLSNASTEALGLTVVGLDDPRTKHDDAALAFKGAGPSPLVIAHSPVIADELADRGARLILCGHTHGGQLHLPKLTDALGRRVGLDHVGGLAELGPSSTLYVNAGLGHSRKGMRWGEPAIAEVAIFDLLPEGSV
jgi:uncharacterized protein